MNSSYHDSNKLIKAIISQVNEKLRNSGFNLFRSFETEQKRFEEDFENLDKEKNEVAESIEQQEMILNELNEKKAIFMKILDLENGKSQILHDVLGVGFVGQVDEKNLMLVKEEMKSRILALKELLNVFARASSMRIENLHQGYRFVFWNIRQSQPGKEFWVEVYVSEGKMKMGEVSDYFYGRENLITNLETHHDLLSFLKSIRKKFKEI